MTGKILRILLIGAAFAISVLALPMKRQTPKVKVVDAIKPKVAPTKLHEQEKELEDLAKLQQEKVNNAVVQTSSDVKVVEENGKTARVVKTTNKVVDSSNGKVLSSVKKIRKIGQNKGGKPEVVAETKVDIPAENIHETFQDNLFDSEPQEDTKSAAFKKSLPENEAYEESVMLNPETEIKDLVQSSESIAKYLLETGRFDKLDQSLRDVIRIGLMSKSEANEYKKMVLEYYEKLMELREAEELQSKLHASPMEYPQQDYALPFNSGDAADQMNNKLDNRLYPYGREAAMMDSSESEDSGRYSNDDGNSEEEEEEEEGYPIVDSSLSSQPEYIDLSDDVLQQQQQPQLYSNRFPEMRGAGQEDAGAVGDILPLARDTQTRDNEDWLNALLEQADYEKYPEAQTILNTISDPRTSRVEREKIQRIIESVLAENDLKDAEDSVEMENGVEDEREMEPERGHEAEEREVEEMQSLRERLRLRNKLNSRLPHRKDEPIALSKKSPLSQSATEHHVKKAVKKQDAKSKQKSA